MKFAKVLTAVALSATFAVAAQANTVDVKVTNATGEIAVFTYEYFSGSVTPSPVDIPAAGSTSFKLTSGADSVSGMRFVYTAGRKECRFAASHITDLRTGVPTFKKTGTSIGSRNASCTANITATSFTAPYNYTVEFQIR